MALKPLLYMISVTSAAMGSVFVTPVIGLIGYLLSYNVNPLSFWWGSMVPDFFQRYSLIFSIVIMVGMVIHYTKIRFVKWFETQEILLLIYIGFMWVSAMTGVPTEALGSNVVKMTKVCLILLVAGHLVTDLKHYNWVVWVYVVSAFLSGLEIYTSDTVSFHGGRLDVGIGGSDFSEGNFLAAHFLMIMPWIGIKFLSGNWAARLFCIVTAGLVVNTLIMIQSRGAFLAIAVGSVMAIFYSGPRFRKHLLALLLAGAMGFVYLSDTSFWSRMDTIDTNEKTMDTSASGRIEAWKAALRMFEEHPFGIGEGNFKRLVGDYNPSIPGKDTHNTFFRCLAELGIQGLALLLLMVQNAFRMLSNLKAQLDPDTALGQAVSLHVLALRVGMVMYLVTTMFLTHTYVEEFYWLLMFPVFLKRSVEIARYEEEALGH